MFTRRLLLTTVAPGALAACTSMELQTVEQQIIDTIQATASAVCGIIPTARTILAVIAGFGVSIANVGAVVLQQVEQAICSSVPPPASARFKAIPLRGSFGGPGPIGNAPTPNGPIPVIGYRTR